MSQLVGLVGKRGQDVTELLIGMIRAASPAEADGYGFANHRNASFRTRLPEFVPFTATAAIGFKLVKVEPLDNGQPIECDSGTLTYTGRLWDTEKPQSIAFSEQISGDPINGLNHLLERDGSYALALIGPDRTLLARDPTGVAPLYLGESTEIFGFASNARMLRAAGLSVMPVTPGAVIEITEHGSTILSKREIHNPPAASTSLEDATAKLHIVLGCSVEARSCGSNSPSIAFSGGVDSTVIAALLTELGVKPRLICVGLEGSPDFDTAEASANALGLPLSIRELAADEFEHSLPDIVRSVEEPDPMKVGVAAPLYFSAKKAGRGAVFSGNGSDELFGGYARYSLLQGEDELRRAIYGDIVASPGVNFERDWKTCADLGVELRLPYTCLPLIEWALTLPTELKIAGGRRKVVLRELAARLSIPAETAERPKKAAQYSSGSAKAIERLAKKRGISSRKYLETLMGGGKDAV